MTDIKLPIDAWVGQAAPAANHGQATNMPVRKVGSGLNCKVLSYVHLPLPEESTVTSAILHFFLGQGYSGTTVWTVSRITQFWSENKVTYNKQPAIDATHAGTLSATSKPFLSRLDIDVTDMLNDVAGGASFYGFMLTHDQDDYRYVISAENKALSGAFQPYISLDWSPPIEAPTNFAPDGENAVSTATPTVTWNFGSDDADRSQSKSRIQITAEADAEDFNSPEYDSGMVANTISNFDTLNAVANYGAPALFRTLGTATMPISTPDPAVITKNGHGLVVGDRIKFSTTGALPTGIVAGTIYYVAHVGGINSFYICATPAGIEDFASYIITSGSQSGTHTIVAYGIAAGVMKAGRVQVQDDLGRNSDWSDTALFMFSPLGKLIMDYPVDGGFSGMSPSVVADTTPGFEWTLTNQTQESLEIILRQVEDGDPTDVDDVEPPDPDEDPAPVEEFADDSYAPEDDNLNAPDEIWRYPRFPTDETVIEPPENLITSGPTYEAELRVWDDVDREGIPGALDYISVTHRFRYKRLARFYTDASPVNTKLSNTPTAHADSANIVNYILTHGSGPVVGGLHMPASVETGHEGTADDFTHPWFFATEDDPLIHLRPIRTGGSGEPPWDNPDISGDYIRIPLEATPAGGSDASIVIVQPPDSNGDVWEYSLWYSQPPNFDTGEIRFNFGRKALANGDGLGDNGPTNRGGITAAAFTNRFGIITYEELLAGEINHALFCSVNGWHDKVYPAATGGGSTGDVGAGHHAAAIGQHLWLDMTESAINALTVPDYAKTILLAAKWYGFYVGDNGGATLAIHFESALNWTAYGEADHWDALGDQLGIYQEHDSGINRDVHYWKWWDQVDWGTKLKVVA